MEKGVKIFWAVLISIAIISSVYFAYVYFSWSATMTTAQKLKEENLKFSCQSNEDCISLWVSGCCNYICINKKIDASEFGYSYGEPDLIKCLATDCILYNCVCEDDICSKRKIG